MKALLERGGEIAALPTSHLKRHTRALLVLETCPRSRRGARPLNG